MTLNNRINSYLFSLLLISFSHASIGSELGYPIVDTGQLHAYNTSDAIGFPEAGEPFHGQDAQYQGNQPSYKDNGDGTITDNVTRLMWTSDPGEKMTYDEAVAGASKCRTGGYNDWRLPSIKELYSLINFTGTDPDANSHDTSNLTPFIDASVFKFNYGKEEDGERVIDSQFATRSLSVSPIMNNMTGMFGVNFADGRIKGYPIENRRGKKTFYVLYVRGNTNYGVNQFVDNGDGTVTDNATGLTWMKADSQTGMNWEDALSYAEEFELAGYSDWRLPNAKELQSIVDYTRSPSSTGTAAIDPVFKATPIENEGGEPDFGWYWSSTSHLRSGHAETAVYVTFGRSLGWMPDRNSSGDKQLLDVHGAGSQRSDPKTGDASRYPHGRGPQGDVIRIENLVRLVRGGEAVPAEEGPEIPKATISAASSRRPPPAGGFIQRFDRNGDGQVERSEFDGPSQRFNRLDQNHDGVITSDEAPSPPPRRN